MLGLAKFLVGRRRGDSPNVATARFGGLSERKSALTSGLLVALHQRNTRRESTSEPTQDENNPPKQFASLI